MVNEFYDEIVFNEPRKDFLATLTRGPVVEVPRHPFTDHYGTFSETDDLQKIAAAQQFVTEELEAMREGMLRHDYDVLEGAKAAAAKAAKAVAAVAAVAAAGGGEGGAVGGGERGVGTSSGGGGGGSVGGAGAGGGVETGVGLAQGSSLSSSSSSSSSASAASSASSASAMDVVVAE